MDVLAPLIVIVLLGVVVWLVSGPLRAGAAAAEEAEAARRDDLEAAKEAKYREIRDAELDYRTGKLSEDGLARAGPRAARPRRWTCCGVWTSWADLPTWRPAAALKPP